MTRFSDPVSFEHGAAIKNRFMLAPLTSMQSNEDGSLSDAEYEFLTHRAAGGFGLVMTCASNVRLDGKAFKGQLGCWSDDHLPGLTRLADGIRARGALSAVQLHHGGERSDPALNGGIVYAPWDDPEKGVTALTTSQVAALVESFAAAAVRCQKAGFDGVEIHGAHGYMLAAFLNETRNQREDGYGGSYENRARIFHEVIDAIRAATRPDFQLGLRLSPERFGVTLGAARQLATEMMTGGKLDYLDMSLWSCMKTPEEAEFADRPLIDWFTDLDRGNCRLGVAGGLLDGAVAQACLDHGADFVLIGRGAILHHDFPLKAASDTGFASRKLPVAREYLASERVGGGFIDYLATTWPNFVEPEPA